MPAHNKQPLTDDHGRACLSQIRVIEQRGEWFLLYDQSSPSRPAVHEFRVHKGKEVVLVEPRITLQDAKRKFDELAGPAHVACRVVHDNAPSP